MNGSMLRQSSKCLVASEASDSRRWILQASMTSSLQKDHQVEHHQCSRSSGSLLRHRFWSRVRSLLSLPLGARSVGIISAYHLFNDRPQGPLAPSVQDSAFGTSYPSAFPSPLYCPLSPVHRLSSSPGKPSFIGTAWTVRPGV